MAVVGGGLSYSSVFKTGLEEKKQEKRETWSPHLTPHEGVILSSLMWPNRAENSVYY